jgi:transcriptional regulator with XRE-family HTH domain
MSFKTSGVRLKEYRKQLGLSSKEMAGRLGISVAAYHKNESGETFPRAATLTILEKEYDISMDWLMFGKGPVNYNRERERIESLQQELATLNKEREHILAKEKELAGKIAVENKPGLQELLECMEQDSLCYHDVMLHFRKFKMTAGATESK